MKHTHAERLDRMIRYGIITDPERCDMAHAILTRIDASVMTQEDVARRWPRILAAMICESLGYFTPRAAANMLLSHKLKLGIGCEYYYMLAGFEKESPNTQEDYLRGMRQAAEKQIRRSVACTRYEGHYDKCQHTTPLPDGLDGVNRCDVYRYMHYPLDNHEFKNEPLDHRGCRHYRVKEASMMSHYRYALELVRQLAGGAENPPALLASWF